MRSRLRRAPRRDARRAAAGMARLFRCAASSSSSSRRCRSLAYGGNGRVSGRRVPDGLYIVRLVYRSTVLAAHPLRIDATAPRLAGLRFGDGSSQFKGDTDLLTTVSPNGDRFRDLARVRFNLTEPATVTLEVSRTVKTPRPF